MSTLETAIRIAVTAHAGQTEKGGAAYITHPLRLMASMDGEAAKIVAVLHDVIEDTTVTIEDLRREGFGVFRPVVGAEQPKREDDVEHRVGSYLSTGANLSSSIPFLHS